MRPILLRLRSHVFGRRSLSLPTFAHDMLCVVRLRHAVVALAKVGAMATADEAVRNVARLVWLGWMCWHGLHCCADECVLGVTGHHAFRAKQGLRRTLIKVYKYT